MKRQIETNGKVGQVVSLITCCLMLMAVSIHKDHKLFGYELTPDGPQVETVASASDSVTVISTRELGKDVMGFGGNTPLEIYIKNGIITNVKPLPNSETPDFFDKVLQSDLFSQWIGRTPQEALVAKVDAVSGATFSSNAVIQNMRLGLESVVQMQDAERGSDSPFGLPLKVVCASVVLLLGIMLPLFVRSRIYRMVQLILNVVVLGFWCGYFLSYSLLINFFSNGIHAWSAVVVVLLLTAGFILPLFGKKSHYCSWICPLGSCQELIGKGIRYKIRLTPKVLEWLNRFREVLWSVLMLFLWSGVLFEWMDYELFTAFLFRQASTTVVVIAVLFLLLSMVVSRPYCRFVCPMGSLLRISQNSK